MPIWLAIKTCLKDKLFVTGGRAGRAEFWWFTLFTILVRVAMYPLNLAGYAGIIFAAVSFLLFIGNYTVLTRRLHDTDRSIIHAFPLIVGLLLGLAGFFMNVRLAVTVGEVIAAAAFVYLLVLCALPGTKGANRYGDPMPLGAAPVAETPVVTRPEPKEEAPVVKTVKKTKPKTPPQPLPERPKHQRKFK